MSEDFILPHSDEAERAVLGALLTRHPSSAEIFEMLTEQDFFSYKHQVIYRSLLALWNANQPTDLVTASEQFPDEESRRKIDGIAYLSSLIDGCYSKMPLTSHAKSVRDKKIRRMLIAACERIKQSVAESENLRLGCDVILDRATEEISAISKLCETDDAGKTEHDAAVNFVSALYEGTPRAINTGIKSIDEITGGFRGGELTIITAETGVGKTHFARQISRRACRDNVHGLYASGEMFAEHLVGRSLAADTAVSYGLMRHPERLTDAALSAVTDGASRCCKVCRILDGEISLPRIRLAARLMSRDKKLGCVFVDYDELVEVRGEDEWDQQRILVRSLKSLAVELHIPVVLVSQLRKSLQGEDRTHPTLQRLYGSGAKAKHANVVLYLDRPFVQELQGDETKAAVYVLKNRDGKIGKVECSFNVRTFALTEETCEVKPDQYWDK